MMQFLHKIKWWLVAVLIVTTTVLIVDDLEFEATLFGFATLSLLLVIGVRWILREIRFVNELKNEKAKTELQHLKSQVNPHFFFNMLNNLYGLIDIDSKKAQQLVLKLSDMMRYSIYDGQQELVTIQEEIAYLQNYIELHRMRYKKDIEIQFEIDLQHEDAKITPLLFIILVENAFKHGVENLRKNAFVHIQMRVKKRELRFCIENNFDPSEEERVGGIGLKNLKRRLELSYPEKHDLSLFKNEDVFVSELILSLV
jgi:LytS/YehU family sensor histidine kinase